METHSGSGRNSFIGDFNAERPEPRLDRQHRRGCKRGLSLETYEGGFEGVQAQSAQAGVVVSGDALMII